MASFTSCLRVPSLDISWDDVKGRSLIISSACRAGDIVASEVPVARWTSLIKYKTVCDCCLRVYDNLSNICGVCNRVGWCGEKCMSLELQDHVLMCPFLKKGMEFGINDDTDSILRLVLRVLCLKVYGKIEDFHRVCDQSMSGVNLSAEEILGCNQVWNIMIPSTSETDSSTTESSILSDELSSLTIEFLYDLVKKDKSCGFAYMMPCRLRADINPESNKLSFEEDNTIIRGYAVLPRLALANHSCLPNVARWDHVDDEEATSPTILERVSVEYRALYSLNPGDEICQSYVPITWSRNERQQYLYENFGFHCRCDRCNLEERFAVDNDSVEEECGEGEDDTEWVDEECSEADPEQIRTATDEDDSMRIEEAEEGHFTMDMNYVSLYLLRHTCTRENCSGLMTPIPDHSFSVSSDYSFYECNVCGMKRSNQEFMEEVKHIFLS